MRITDVRVIGRCLPRSFVEVETDQGIVGIGLTGSPSDLIAPIVEAGVGPLRDLLIGEDCFDVGRLWRKMFQQWQAQRGRGGEGGLAVNAMGAIDMALWDALGKATGQPLHRLLGGAVHKRLMAYASATAYAFDPHRPGVLLGHKSAEELAEESRTYTSQGFKAIKYGWGNNFRPEDEEKLAAIRDAIGPEVYLMIDFGCPAYWCHGWSVKQAIRAGRILERYDVYFFEECMPPLDVEGHQAVTRALDIHVATGESLTTTNEFHRFIDRRAVDIVQPDAGQMGISQLVDVARSAEAAGLLCIPHSPWSALTVAAHRSILATVNNGPMIEYPGVAGNREKVSTLNVPAIPQYQIVEELPVLEDGFLPLPESPGLGLGGFVPEAISQWEAFAHEERKK